MHQLPDPSASFLITKTFQGLCKLRPTVDTRQPITSDLLHKLIGSLSIARLTGPRNDLILFCAMFLFAFYVLCRISDIRFLTNPHRLIVLFAPLSILMQNNLLHCTLNQGHLSALCCVCVSIWLFVHLPPSTCLRYLLVPPFQG